MRARLQSWTPSEFLRLHNPEAGLHLIKCNAYSGMLALDARIPTLAQIAEVYGEGTVMTWLKCQLDSVDVILGANALGEHARHDACRLIFAKYKDINVGNLLHFFAKYKLGEYMEQVAYVGGVEKILLALRLYMLNRNDDVARIERNRDVERAWAERQQWERKAISYDEYIKGK